MDELLALADDRKLDTVENSTSKVHEIAIMVNRIIVGERTVTRRISLFLHSGLAGPRSAVGRAPDS